MGNNASNIVVIEFLDPECPYCALFNHEYSSTLNQLIANETITYEVYYFPTHVVGYYQEGNSTAFTYGVANWLIITHVWSGNPQAGLQLLEGAYNIAFNYLIQAQQATSQQEAMVLFNDYPIAQYNYLSTYYPINITMSTALEIVDNASNNVMNVLQSLNLPQQMYGTPLFIVYNPETHLAYAVIGADPGVFTAIKYVQGGWS